MKGLIWEDEDNIIDVVYQSIYGVPVKEAMEIVRMYTENQLIPKQWLKQNMYYTLYNKWDMEENEKYVNDVIGVINEWRVTLQYETDR